MDFGHFRHLFGIDFWMPFWTPFFRLGTSNGRLLAPVGRLLRPYRPLNGDRFCLRERLFWHVKPSLEPNGRRERPRALQGLIIIDFIGILERFAKDFGDLSMILNRF